MSSRRRSASMVGECRCRCECGLGRGSSSSSNASLAPAPKEAEAEAVLVLELEGVAMAGLVNILRQLGDLAELAADVLDDLQDQVTATSARGRRLAVRAKRLQLQADDDLHRRLPLTVPVPAGRVGVGWPWRADLKVSHGFVAGANMPRLVAGHIKRCRGPPALSVLDRFDTAGQGACLKRYTDPSIFRTQHYSAAANKLQQAKQHMLRDVVRPPKTRVVVAQKQQQQHESSSSDSDEQQQQPVDISSAAAAAFTTTSPPEQGGELKLMVERTSSLEAWLSPHDDDETSNSNSNSGMEISGSLLPTRKQQQHDDPSSRSSAATAIGGVGDSIITADDECSCSSTFPPPTEDSVVPVSYPDAQQQGCDDNQDTKVEQVDAAPPPIPPIMQWLPDKVRIRPAAASASITRRPRPRTQPLPLLEATGQQHSRSSSQTEIAEHVAVVGSESESSSNLQKDVPSPLLLDEAGSHHDRITLRNGPSLIHPSRNIMDSMTVEASKRQVFQSETSDEFTIG